MSVKKKSAKHDIVQVKNPRTDRYVKIDRCAQEIRGPLQGCACRQKSEVIIYNPLDGEALTSAIKVNPRYCLLMTRLGSAVPVLPLLN